MKGECFGISFENVLDLLPERLGIIIRTPHKEVPVDIIHLPKNKFQVFKFEAIKWIKARPHPEDRVWNFEKRNHHGVWCYDKETRLVEARKTPKEKENEKQERKWLHEQARKLGLDLS